MGGIPLQFDAQGMQWLLGTATAELEYRGERRIEQLRRSELAVPEPIELHTALVLSFDHAHFFRAAENFITCHALYGVPKVPGMLRGDVHRVMVFLRDKAWEFQTNSRIVAEFRQSTPKSKELLGRYHAFAQLHKLSGRPLLRSATAGSIPTAFNPT
jgi:hypothetical protein